jgi:hypothetical protein
MKRLVFRGVLLCALLVCQVPRTTAQVAPQNGSSVCAAGPLILYDDFRGPRIDPNKWTGIWGDFSDLREMTREITGEPRRRDRALRVSMRSYANTWDDSGGLGGPFGLLFTQPDRVTEVAFTATVRAAEAIGCTTNPGMAAAVAEFRGQFFNDGTGTAGSQGDVQVALTINRFATDLGGAMEVQAFYNRCDDPYCGSQTNLGWGSLGYVYPGQPVRLRVKWDQPNHQFIFRMDNQPAFVSPYTVSDTTPASGAFRYIGLTRILPNCTTTPRPTAMVDARFSDVYVNAP